jgi:hypothetical protein
MGDYLLQKKKDKEEVEMEEGRTPCHKLNITDGKSIDNTIGRNATSPYDLLS